MPLASTKRVFRFRKIEVTIANGLIKKMSSLYSKITGSGRRMERPFKMFCPYCGRNLVMKKGRSDYYYYCEAGDMGVSQNLERRLIDVFISKTTPSSTTRLRYGVGGRWFCPADGSSMIESDGFVNCTTCQLSLNGFFFELIELHPHKELHPEL
jgi:hypothetical protein